ncbi:MAG: SIS domain-containing protein [Chloroflexales bacterium]|nr:SIS domain-containing protein [Chloroflexales bacterium]
MPPSFRDQLREAQALLAALEPLAAEVDRVATLVVAALRAGGTIYTCGNGGSATDAAHLSEELVGRYRANRRPLPAVCLNADGAALTCIANDFGYDQVFARPIAALGWPGDVLVCFSTSGNSPNLLAALAAARAKGVATLALLGGGGGAARALADHALIVPSSNGARVQEAHTLLLHAICEAVEAAYVE